MKKTLKFQIPSQMPTFGTCVAWLFPFTMVDSSLVGAPEEFSKTSPHQVQVDISFLLMAGWGFHGAYSGSNPNLETRSALVKVLFEFGHRDISKKLKETGQLAQENFLSLRSPDQPNHCPYDYSRIKEPDGAVFEVEIYDKKNLKEMRRTIMLYVYGRQMADCTSDVREADINEQLGLSEHMLDDFILRYMSGMFEGNLYGQGYKLSADGMKEAEELLSTDKPLTRNRNIANRFTLLSKMSNALSFDEISILCFGLGINRESLRPNQGIEATIADLVTYCERSNRMPELKDWLKVNRSAIDWDILF